MSFLSQVLVTMGLLSLFHAAYSASEHSAALSLASRNTNPSSSSTTTTTAKLPLDIQIETLISLLLLLVGLVLGSEKLKPIAWSTWAGNIEKETGGGANPFRTLEDRVGFMDIRAKRRDFAAWVREGGGSAGVKTGTGTEMKR